MIANQFAFVLTSHVWQFHINMCGRVCLCICRSDRAGSTDWCPAMRLLLLMLQSGRCCCSLERAILFEIRIMTVLLPRLYSYLSLSHFFVSYLNERRTSANITLCAIEHGIWLDRIPQKSILFVRRMDKQILFYDCANYARNVGLLIRQQQTIYDGCRLS